MTDRTAIIKINTFIFQINKHPSINSEARSGEANKWKTFNQIFSLLGPFSDPAAAQLSVSLTSSDLLPNHESLLPLQAVEK